MPIEWARGSLPGWALDLDRWLSVHSQFVISGNIRDLYPVTLVEGGGSKAVLEVIWEVLANRGCEFMLVYDPVDNLRVLTKDQVKAANKVAGLSLNEQGREEVSQQRLVQLMATLTCSRGVVGALVVDYASRLVPRGNDLTAEQHKFFVSCEKLSHQARQLRPRSGENPPFNPIVWLVNEPRDLPNWYTLGNETIRHLVAGLPDREARALIIAKTEAHFPDTGRLADSRRRELMDQFTLLTEGMSARSLLSITEIARDPRFGLERIADAIRVYKVGVPEDPWKQPLIRDRIRNGRSIIAARVKGQTAAIDKVLDILTRSVMGLTGAQAHRTGGRPRGVLFFAGPTGVGKTELAKALTQLLFGDESAYQRFDMSEFSSEHAEARLIGAPPGYVGHDSGGELVNAVRQRPFSVLLFDEIDKAHHRILDKFLQILEDGRLTDGRGETVFFSETVIVFTSNRGMFVEGEDGSLRPNVTIEDDYATVEERVTKAIKEYFQLQIQRPELLNRIGENLVIFDFVRRPVACEILEKMLQGIFERVREEHGLIVRLSDDARPQLETLCLDRLEDGGRGIGSRLESLLINPLGRALFCRAETPGTVMTIDSFVNRAGRWELAFL